MSANSRQDVADAEHLLQAVRKEWMARNGVRGVGIGLIRNKAGFVTEQVGIQVTVSRKLPEDEVPKDELFPKRLGRFRVQILEGEPGLE